MDDWEIVSEGAGTDCSSWEITDYPGAAFSERFSEAGSEMVRDGDLALVAAHVRMRQELMMHLLPVQGPTEVQRVRRPLKPSYEVVKGGKHWQCKQALMAKAHNKTQQNHKKSKILKGTS